MKDKTFDVLKYVNLVALFFGIIGLIYVIRITDIVAVKIQCVIEIIAILAAFEYFLRGAKKDAAKYYKMYMLFIAATYILECLAFIFSKEPEVSVVYFAVTLILYGNHLLLGASKDLGKRVSMSLVSFNLIVQIIAFIRSVFQLISMSDLVLTTVGVFSAGICLIMTIAKYKDKATRNSK